MQPQRQSYRSLRFVFLLWEERAQLGVSGWLARLEGKSQRFEQNDGTFSFSEIQILEVCRRALRVIPENLQKKFSERRVVEW